jgi:tetratricopeptide (TPR) repeat protein
MLDRHGNRIDRRNAQDIFVPLYQHQIPPGAGQTVHYRFQVPEKTTAPITAKVRLLYRKFDEAYMDFVDRKTTEIGRPVRGHKPDAPYHNELPILVLAEDQFTFPVAGTQNPEVNNPPRDIPEWQRWNDYGIGLFLKGDKGSEKGELIQAAGAFNRVEALGRADGPLNLARVFFKEGRLDDAVAALQRANDAKRFDPPGNRWTIAWLNGLVNKQNGFLDESIQQLTSILEDRYPELEKRGFDFSRDYEVINELGQTLFERAKMERANPARKEEFLRAAATRFDRTLTIDPENLTAHYNLGLIHASLGDSAASERHRKLHERYRPDDNARDRAVATARRNNPAADHATQAIVLYDLQHPQSLSIGASQSRGVSTSSPIPAPLPAKTTAAR